jgi:hypothetical protein
MEEVIGSIPIRSTKTPQQLAGDLRDQFPKSGNNPGTLRSDCPQGTSGVFTY